MATFFHAAGLLLLGVALWAMLRDDWRFLRARRLRTRGTVVRHSASTDEDGGMVYRAVISFWARNGRTVEVIDSVGYPTARPPVGSRVDIVYPETEPERARIPRRVLRTMIYAFMLGGIVVVVLSGAGILR